MMIMFPQNFHWMGVQEKIVDKTGDFSTCIARQIFGKSQLAEQKHHDAPYRCPAC